MMKRILITGAAGKIGSVLREGLRKHIESILLLDIAPLGTPQPHEEFLSADIRDLSAMKKAMVGVDAVIHLAAIPTEKDFHNILETNIIGTYNVFEAARISGCRRIVFASTNHVVGFYPTDKLISPDRPMRPDTYYGVSKAFGGNLARLYVDKYKLEAICIRIGSFEIRPKELRHLSTWLSPRDAVHLFHRCLVAPNISFVTLFEISANMRAWWANSEAEVLGYHPQDNAEEYADEILSQHGNANTIASAHFQGGKFTEV
jgi:uronate dehydrogenase